jgi:hypothetical protein
LLSVRTLCFGRRRLMWECNKHLRSEDLHTPLLEMLSPSRKMDAAVTWLRSNIGRNHDKHLLVQKRPLETLKNTGDVYRYWNDIIRTYSRCKLIYQQDKLPALSGLARNFASTLHDTYLAGIWKGNLHNGLLWVCPMPTNHMEVSQGSRAPSWSWTSIDGEVLPSTVNTEPERAVMVLISVTPLPRGLDEFIHVSGRCLQACSYLKRGEVGSPVTSKNRWGDDLSILATDLRHPSKHFNGPLEFFLGDKVVAKLHLDHSNDHLPAVATDKLDQASTRKIELYAFLVRELSEGISGFEGWDALAIEKLPSGQYRRVGTLHCFSTAGDCFDDNDLQIIEIV